MKNGKWSMVNGKSLDVDYEMRQHLVIFTIYHLSLTIDH